MGGSRGSGKGRGSRLRKVREYMRPPRREGRRTDLKKKGQLWDRVARAERKLAAAASDAERAKYRAKLGRLAGELREEQRRRFLAAAPPPPPEAGQATASAAWKGGKRRGPSQALLGVDAVLNDPDAGARKRQRRDRFAEGGEAGPGPGSPRGGLTVTEAKRLVGRGRKVVGHSQALEKSYLRLTSAPALGDVRPPAVLRESLRLVQEKLDLPLWKDADARYAYATDQLKSIRQDLVVQDALGGHLAIAVYETHGRAALEAGDLAEFGTCCAQLRRLHAAAGPAGAPNADEFCAYGLLHAWLRGGAGAALHELRAVPPAGLDGPAVRHARAVLAALHASDFRRFFALRARAPPLADPVLDPLARRVRRAATRVMVQAFQPDWAIGLDLFGAAVGLEDDPAAARACALEHGAVLSRDCTAVDVRLSRLAMAASG